MPLSSPLFVIYGDYGYSPRDRGAGRSEAARKMIFFRNRGGISKGGDRNWPTASYRDSHRSCSLLSSPLSATDPRFELETFVFFSTIDRIYVHVCISFRGQFYTPLQPNEIRIIITDGRRGKETLSFSNTFHPCDKIAHRFHNGKGTFDSKEREKKFPPRAKRVFPPSIIIAVPSRAVYK